MRQAAKGSRVFFIKMESKNYPRYFQFFNIFMQNCYFRICDIDVDLQEKTVIVKLSKNKRPLGCLSVIFGFRKDRYTEFDRINLIIKRIEGIRYDSVAKEIPENRILYFRSKAVSFNEDKKKLTLTAYWGYGKTYRIIIDVSEIKMLYEHI